MPGPLSIYWLRCGESGLQCVCVNTRSSWLITHGPSEPFPFSQPVTHVQTNQLQGQHLSQPQHRYSRLKFTTVFAPQDGEHSLCFHSVHRQASAIDLSWNTRFHQVLCPGNNSICLFLQFHIVQGSKSRSRHESSRLLVLLQRFSVVSVRQSSEALCRIPQGCESEELGTTSKDGAFSIQWKVTTAMGDFFFQSCLPTETAEPWKDPKNSDVTSWLLLASSVRLNASFWADWKIGLKSS